MNVLGEQTSEWINNEKVKCNWNENVTIWFYLNKWMWYLEFVTMYIFSISMTLHLLPGWFFLLLVNVTLMTRLTNILLAIYTCLYITILFILLVTQKVINYHWLEFLFITNNKLGSCHIEDRNYDHKSLPILMHLRSILTPYDLQ